MPTRRTTMRSKSGTKLYAVRDESGQFKDIQTYKRAHGADLRQKSQAEKEAAQGPIEKNFRTAAKEAVKSVKSTVKGAVAAVKKVAKQAMKRTSSASPARTTADKVAAQGTTRKPAPKAPAKVATKKTARKAARAK